MSPKLPPLSWFRAFDAAARHLSVTAAARELGLSQPAVSQQIQMLEHRFNMTLFERRPRGLVLTDAGRRLLPQVAASIDGLTRLISEFDVQQEKTRLTIAASASFVRDYIAPVLPGFLDLHPNLRTRVRTTLWHDDYLHSDADLEIRFGSTALAGKGAVELSRDQVIAVCAPDVFSGQTEWADICAARRVQTVAISESWERWASALKLPVPQTAPHIVDSHSLGIDFALSGMGVALTSLLLAAPYLHSGDLVMPVRARVDASERYFLVVRDDAPHMLAKPLADQIQRRASDMMQETLDRFFRDMPA